MPLKQILRMDANRKEDDQSSKTGPQPAPPLHRKGPNFAKKKDKFGRKRSQSFSGVNSKFCPPYKYRTRPMLPTKFLLGGNICDPLNLNSLQDEEVNRTVNAITPKSSPIPTPPQRRGHIEVIIPPNIHDPLNLIDCADDAEYEQQLTSPLKKGNKRRKKKKRTSSATTEPSDADISASEAQTPDLSNDSAKIPDLEPTSTAAAEDAAAAKEKLTRVTRELKLELSPAAKDKKRKSDSHKEGVKKLRRLDSMDKIVSPVVPQPGAWLKRALQFNRNAGPSNRGQNSRPNAVKTKETGGKVPHFRDKNKAYQYGNYNRYYGYRNPNHEVDSRLRCFAAHRHIFEGRDILDIGCNIGHITLSIARDFGAKSVVGIDIDKKLIGIARKNVRHYVNCDDSPRDEPECGPRPDKNDKCFPISMPILYGPVDVPGMQNDEVRGRGFPHNVTFVQGNYVLDDDSLLSTEQPQFDVILCLSITKWLHLNWGDQGLKQAFRRMYAQLKPGGRLILEPQSWASYKHKKTLTETIYKHYNSIEFFPEKFTQYLLSSEVGFAKSEIMGQPHHAARGFQRPIQVFTRSNLSPSQSQRSYSITPSHTVTSSGSCRAPAGATGGGGVGKQVYTCLPSPDVCVYDPAGVRVDHSAMEVAGGVLGRSTEHLEAVRDAKDDRGAVRSAGGRCKGTGRADSRDVLGMGQGIADKRENRSGNAVESLEGADRFMDTANSGADNQEQGSRMKDRRDKGSRMKDRREQGTDNHAEIVDNQENAYKIADKAEQGSEMADKRATSTDNQEPGSKIADNQAKIADKHAEITGEQARITGEATGADNEAKITDNQAKIIDKATVADNQATITDKQAKITDKHAEITGEQAMITDIATVADNQATVADNQATITDNQATITDNQATIIDKATVADNQARITDKHATITDKATVADNQARITDNRAKITDKHATITDKATITDNQLKITDNRAKITDKHAAITDKATVADYQATITHKSTYSPDNQTKPPHTPDNQAKPSHNPDNQTKPPHTPDNQAKPSHNPDNQAKPSHNPDNQTKPRDTPVNQTITYTNATNTSLTLANTPDNRACRPGMPHNQATSPRIEIVNNKCKNIDELCGNQVTNAPSNNVGRHLGSTTSATAVTCSATVVGTTKRKHTTVAASPTNESSPAKRRYTSPAKRQYTTNSLAVKRPHPGAVTYTKRKNLQSTPGSTLTDTDSTLTRRNDGEKRLDDTLADHEQISADCQSTIDKSTTVKSTQHRLAQKTKRIMDNT